MVAKIRYNIQFGHAGHTNYRYHGTACSVLRAVNRVHADYTANYVDLVI